MSGARFLCKNRKEIEGKRISFFILLVDFDMKLMNETLLQMPITLAPMGAYGMFSFR